MPSSNTPPSNWDFTPVINLLCSPTYTSGDRSIPALHHDSDQEPSTSEVAAQSVNGSTPGQKLENGGPPKLGDFSALWDILGNTTPPVGAEAGLRQTTKDNVVEQPPQQPKRIQILKRPSHGVNNLDDLEKALPRTPPRPILVSDKSKSRRATIECRTVKSRDQPRQPVDEPQLSESTAEAESDNPSIFEPSYSKRGVVSLVPPQVGIAEALSEPSETPPSSFDEADGALTPIATQNLPGGAIRVRPIAYKSATDRRVGLLTKLLKDFPDYADAVIQVGRLGKSRPVPSPTCRPIHVFVDMSNIMVGYHDSMKVSRNIPVKTRIRRLPLSFQNFSLVLERGRPTAKRVLVGSDRFAAIDEGEKLGYETNILDRVHKVKQPTRRQLKFRKNPRTGAQDGGSGSETNDAPGERWVEQGVDEILHLKILESLLDTDEPATIVLATGDAAEAEFSGGFMKMVERALRRGWTVELVSFSQVTSFAYRKKEFRSKWGNQFKMIALDGYIEELLDM
ncbi:NYN domain-containing protein [Aspergillus alliaceus]|uniref:NYN domain-containing protein n=1 Tax=Petromyces alliaceus TaxID=209559 RepID=UPI0012A5813E|nr:uncharacterized protein BDW43DRAFT_274895 [Aspergillus alliaceus]KAB8234059.1 hypothetical protein BDW43DRAFT_274895 [Aspergillus alliaceus]